MQYYFDYAAATPIDDTVVAAMQPYFADQFYNPSALYLAAQDVKRSLQSARETVARILGAKPSEIIFTAGGTEANNLALSGIMQRYPRANVVTSAVEHEAVLEPARLYRHKTVPVRPDGRIDLDALKRAIDDETVLVSVMYANNEIGTVQPLGKISTMIRSIRAERATSGNLLPLYLHTDACQAPNYLHVLVNALGVDLMTLNGGKVYGPKQSGCLFVRSGIELEPQIRGGGQERNLRSGTENVAAAIGFSVALEEASMRYETERTRIATLRDSLLDMITKQLPEVVCNGSMEHRLPNNIHLTLPGTDNERVMMELDERGCMVATGSACSASSEEPSHVLKAIGLSDEAARSSIRITLGRGTDQAAIDALARALTSIG